MVSGWLLVGFGASVRQLFETLGLAFDGFGAHLHVGVRIGAFRFLGLVFCGGFPDGGCDHGTDCGMVGRSLRKKGLSRFRKP